MHRQPLKQNVSDNVELNAELGRHFCKAIVRAFDSSSIQQDVNNVDERRRNALLLLFLDDYVDGLKQYDFVEAWILQPPPSVSVLLDKYYERDPFNILRRAYGHTYNIKPEEYDTETLYEMRKGQKLWHQLEKRVWMNRARLTRQENANKVKMVEYIALNALATYFLATDRNRILSEIVQQLIYLKLDVTTKDDSGKDLLDYICRSRFFSDEAKLSVIHTIRRNNIYISFDNSQAALYKILSVRRDMTESTVQLVQLLIKNGVKVDQCLIAGETPLWIVCKYYRDGVYSDTRLFFRCVRLLLTCNTANMAPKNKTPPLLELLDNPAIYKAFDGKVDWGDDGESVQEDDYEKKTFADFLALFFEKECDPNARDEKKCTALIKICAHCKGEFLMDAVLLLLHVGANATLADSDGDNALMHLLRRKRGPLFEVAKVLLASQVPPTAVNNLGQNAMMLACANNTSGEMLYSIIDFFCKCGVNPNASRRDGAVVASSSCKWNDAAGAIMSNLSTSVIKMNAQLLSLLKRSEQQHLKDSIHPNLNSDSESPLSESSLNSDEDFYSALESVEEAAECFCDSVEQDERTAVVLKN